jgi:hypothetical protein
MNQQIKTSVGVIIVLIIVVTVGVFTWKAIGIKNTMPALPINPVQTLPTKTNPSPIACTQEAKQCPDGSYVSRTGPNCEFAACPEKPVAASSGLIYKNTDYGFEVSLPMGWEKYQVSVERDKGDTKHTYFYFMLPTTDKTWVGSYNKNTGGVIPGMADIFVITANDLVTWNSDLNSKECKENPNPSCPYEGDVIAKNGKYVFDAGYGNGMLPPDVQKFRVGNSAIEFLSGKFKLLD